MSFIRMCVRFIRSLIFGCVSRKWWRSFFSGRCLRTALRYPLHLSTPEQIDEGRQGCKSNETASSFSFQPFLPTWLSAEIACRSHEILVHSIHDCSQLNQRTWKSWRYCWHINENYVLLSSLFLIRYIKTKYNFSLS